MGKARLYTKKDVIALVLKHYPYVTNDRGNYYWYCKCGVYLDMEKNYGSHLEQVVQRTPGSVSA